MAKLIDTERLKAYHRKLSGFFMRRNEVVNNLTSGGANVPLSAEMGKELNREMGGSLAPMSISVTSSGTHSSSRDQVSVPVKVGEKYIFTPYMEGEIASGNVTFQIFEYDADGSGGTSKASLNPIENGKPIIFNAIYDNPKIGVYIRNNTPDTMTFGFGVSYGSTGLIDGLQNMVVNQESATGFDTTSRGKQFATLYSGKNDVEAFVYFTDPHAMGGSDNFTDANKTRFNNLLRYITSFHKTIPSSFVLCGGDWLNNGDTKAVATWKLGLLNQFRTSMNIKQVVGNHDYNYQGNNGTLTAKQVARLMFIDEEKTYYTFDTPLTKYFVLDTEIDTDEMVNGMSNYKWEQIDWLANQLLTNTKGHIVIAMHMYRKSPTGAILAMSNNLQALLAAFNSRETITLNEQTYDFSDCTGKVAYIICGHTHVDTIYTEAEIPVVTTKNVETNFDFDLVCCDYSNGKLYLLRALGNNTARSVDIIV